MKKLRSYLAAASVRLGLPMDIAAGLPHLEVNGFRECSVDRHTGILEYAYRLNAAEHKILC